MGKVIVICDFMMYTENNIPDVFFFSDGFPHGIVFSCYYGNHLIYVVGY